MVKEEPLAIVWCILTLSTVVALNNIRSMHGANTKMKFGKFKGAKAKDIPLWYLRFAKNLEGGPLQKFAELEIDRREYQKGIDSHEAAVSRFFESKGLSRDGESRQ